MRVRVELTPHRGRDSDRVPHGWPRDTLLWTAVAIDVLRAASTLALALRNGARRVLAVATPEEALARKRGEPDALLCGERDGRRIGGFDLGNSPAEYGFESVAGRSLIFASTNGSIALRSIAGCGVRLPGAFVNGSAVARALAGQPYVLLVCAGKLGGFALEDAAFAGWLCERLGSGGACIEGAAARLARSLAPRDALELRAVVQGSEHGRYLRSLGPEYAADVEFCARLDVIGQAHEV